jgi:hypothetical protein
VPVSLITTFAVLLVMGYSANTVSLLAMVLAIGIVVDDAIVVVENVERVMEEEPELSPAEATKKAMAQITAPIIAITLVLLSVFVPIGFIPGLSGVLFRQFAVTISVAMVISAINALTLSPALCAVFLRHTGPSAAIMGWVSRRIDNVRDGYARMVTAVAAALAVVSLVLVAAFGFGGFTIASKVPSGFLPSEDQGAFIIAFQLPDGAAQPRTSRVVADMEARLKQLPQVRDAVAIVGLSLLDSSNSVLRRHDVRAAEGVRGAHRSGDNVQALIGRYLPGEPADPQRDDHPDQPAADHRPRHRRRLRVPAGVAGGREPGERSARSCRPGRRGQPGPAAGAGVLHLLRPRALALPGYRPRQGAGARLGISGRVLGAAGHARQQLRQQLQPVRPHLAGAGAGRGRRPRDENDSGRSRSATAGQMVPLRAIAEVRTVIGPQNITRYNNYRSITINGGPAAGISSGVAHAGDGGSLPQHPARRLPSSGRAPPSRERQAQGQTVYILASRWPCCSPSCSWWRCTKAGSFPSPSCSRWWSACWRRSSSRSPASRWTSTRRSA